MGPVEEAKYKDYLANLRARKEQARIHRNTEEENCLQDLLLHQIRRRSRGQQFNPFRKGYKFRSDSKEKAREATDQIEREVWRTTMNQQSGTKVFGGSNAANHANQCGANQP